MSGLVLIMISELALDVAGSLSTVFRGLQYFHILSHMLFRASWRGWAPWVHHPNSVNPFWPQAWSSNTFSYELCGWTVTSSALLQLVACYLVCSAHLHVPAEMCGMCVTLLCF
jgi:hypothetical protein